jgi:hypothetical protein
LGKQKEKQHPADLTVSILIGNQQLVAPVRTQQSFCTKITVSSTTSLLQMNLRHVEQSTDYEIGTRIENDV